MVRLQGRLLGHVSHLDPGLAPDLPVVETALPHQGRQQGRLAGAIAPDQGHPLPRIQLEIRVIKEGHMAKSQAGLVKFQQGHGDSAAEEEVEGAGF